MLPRRRLPITQLRPRRSSTLLGLSAAAAVAAISGTAYADQPPRLEPTDVDKPWGSGTTNQVEPTTSSEAEPVESAPATEDPSAAETSEPEGSAPAPESAPAPQPEPPAATSSANEGASNAESPNPRAEVAQPDKANEGDPKHPFELSGELGKKDRAASITPYGMIVANAAYNTGTPFPSQEAPIGAVKNSRNGDGLPSDGAFIVTARQSRLGLKGAIQISDKVDASGKIEADFFGLHEDFGPGGAPQSGIRLRLAYLDVGGKKWRFLAGQNWSVVTPRLPTSLGHMVIALHTFSGAVWNRLPQLEGVFRQPIDGAKSLGDAAIVVHVAAARSVSHDGFGNKNCPPEIAAPNSPIRPNPSPAPTCRITRFDDPDQGSLSQLPAGQIRVAFESKVFSLGVGGHLGSEKWWATKLQGGAIATDTQRVPTWMVSGDLRIAPKWFWLNAQGYFGRNINGMFSRQGVRANLWNVPTGDPLEGQVASYTALPGFGGWVEIGAPLGTEKVKLVASGGADIGDRDGDLLGEKASLGGRVPGVPDGAVWANFGIFAGLIYAPHPNFDMSLEYYRSTSVYKRWVAAQAEVRNDWGFNDHISTNFRLKF